MKRGDQMQTATKEGLKEVSHEEFNSVMQRLVALLDVEGAKEAFQPFLSCIEQKGSSQTKKHSKKGLWEPSTKDKSEWLTDESVALPLWLFLIVLSFLIFSNALYGGFMLGDTKTLQTYTGVPSDVGTPVADLKYGTAVTFQLDYLLHGLVSHGFRLSNILLHGLVSVLVYFTAQLLFGSDKTASAWAALFFVVHPIHTEAVNYISAREHILQAFFCLLSFLMYSRAGSNTVRMASYMVSALCCVAAYICGGAGATAVLVLNGLYDVLTFLHNRDGKKADIRHPLIWRMLGMAYVGGVSFLFWYIFGQEESILHMTRTDNFIKYAAVNGQSFFLQRWSSLIQVASSYFSLLLWPTNLSIDHSHLCPPLSAVDGALSWLYVIVPVIAGAAGCFYLLHWQQHNIKDKNNGNTSSASAQRKIGSSSNGGGDDHGASSCLSAPPMWRVVMPFAWMVVPLLMESNWFYYTPYLLVERAAYMPSIGFCLSLAWVMWTLRRYAKRRAGKNKRIATLAVSALCCVLFVSYSIGTLRRNSNWNSEDDILKAASLSCNASARVSMQRAIQAEAKGAKADAVKHYRDALSMDPSLNRAAERLGKASLMDGNYTQALQYLRPLINAFPMVYHPSVFHDGGVCYLGMGEYERAAKFFGFVITGNSSVGREYITHSHSNLAIALVRLRRVAEGLKQAEKAAALGEDYPPYHNNLGVIRALLKNFPEAMESFERAVGKPNSPKEAATNKAAIEHRMRNASHPLSLEFSVIVQP